MGEKGKGTKTDGQTDTVLVPWEGRTPSACSPLNMGKFVVRDFSAVRVRPVRARQQQFPRLPISATRPEPEPEPEAERKQPQFSGTGGTVVNTLQRDVVCTGFPLFPGDARILCVTVDAGR